MRVPITTAPQTQEMEQTRSIPQEHGLYDAEDLPAYSREPTEDGYEYEHQTALEAKKGPAVNITETHPAERSYQPTTHEPGYASESILRRGLQVPTKTRLITSGFAYPDILSHRNISEEQWSDFTGEITKVAKLTSSQWTTTVGKGFGTFVVGGLFIGWLGLIPAAIVGHKARQHNEEANWSRARSTNVLQDIINRWNESVFKPRGLLIRVDLPGEATDMDTMDIPTKQAKQPTYASRSASKQSRAEMRAAKKEMCARWKAAKKGRIVILPLGQDAVRLASTMPARDISPIDQYAPSPPYTPTPLAEQTVAEQRTGLTDSYADEKRG